jgi:hypothetical protein
LQIFTTFLTYGFSIATFSTRMVPVYYASRTRAMISLALTHTAMTTGCVLVLTCLFCHQATHAAKKYAPQLKSMFLCTLLSSDAITLMLLGKNLEPQEADEAMCYAFTLTLVTFSIAAVWPIARVIGRIAVRLRRQGLMGSCPDPAGYVPLASDTESRSTDDSDPEPRPDGDGDGDGDGDVIEMQELGDGNNPEGDAGIVIRADGIGINPDYLDPGTSAPRHRNRSSRSSRSSLGRNRDASGSSNRTTDRSPNAPIALIHTEDGRVEGERGTMPALEDEAYTHHWF